MKHPSALTKELQGAGIHILEPESVGRYDDGEGLACIVGDLFVMASWGGGWDHISVSGGWRKGKGRRATRTPSFEEMETIKRMFFEPDEAAVQIHPPVDTYKSTCRHCLHLWRPQDQELHLPPPEFV